MPDQRKFRAISFPLLLLFFAGFLSASPAAAQTKQIRNLKSQSEKLQKQLKESEKMLNTTKKDVSTQLNNLTLIGQQVNEQQKYVDGIQTEVKGLSSDLATLEKQLEGLERDLAECKRKYQRAVLYMFRNRASQNKWMFILSAKNFRQMYRRMRYVSEYSKFQRVQAQMIAQKEAAIREKKNEILGIKKQKDELLSEGKRQQNELNQKKAQQQTIVDDLNKRQNELQAQIAKQRKQQSALNARIDQLVQQEIAAAEARRKAEEAKRIAAEKKRKEEAARKKAEEEKRRQAEAKKKQQQQQQQAAAAKNKQQASGKGNAANSAAAGKGKQTTANNKPAAANTKNNYSASTAEKAPTFVEADNTDRRISGGFSANKGRLPMPITGPYAITAHFGNYNVAGLKNVTLDNKGINITGKSGAQARAVYEGEVTSIFTIAGLHNIIVRHGSYMSVYCNLSGVSVKRGQKVSAGQTLGSVARDASGNYTLHFQLRKETAKLNPEAWLSR